MSGEEAREFLQTAPVTESVQQRRKLEAIAIPIASILALPLLGIALVSPMIAAVAAFFCGCAAVSTALLNLWHPITGRRQDIMRRHSQSKLIGIMEHLFSLLWVLAMMMVLFGSKVAFLPVADRAGAARLQQALERDDDGGRVAECRANVAAARASCGTPKECPARLKGKAARRF